MGRRQLYRVVAYFDVQRPKDRREREGDEMAVEGEKVAGQPGFGFTSITEWECELVVILYTRTNARVLVQAHSLN